MNMDVEALDPELRDFAARLRAAPQASVSAGFSARVMSRLEKRASRPFMAFAAAASVALLLGVAAIFRPQPAPSFPGDGAEPAIMLADGSRPTASIAPYAPSYAVRELARDGAAGREALSAAAAEIARTQNADGGWGVPALTALNTAALAMAVRAGDGAALSAWKRGVRHLRTHGISEADPF